ncbi:MAG: hypothetical protein MK116_07450 [Phycisphaerales bacterium]|nr:hypothetical protein [Phycisphaerales bacterium]
MSQNDPMRRFLGLDASADPIDVLGLDPGQLKDDLILQARAAREKQIDDHPDGRTREAEQVRAHIRDAAAVLLDPQARLPILARHVPARLRAAKRSAAPANAKAITEFDQQVLGVLMASGGWNSRSRSRLMALAAQHDVAPDQLMGVLIGMTRWLREGASSDTTVESAAEPGIGSASAAALAVTSQGPASEAFDRFVDRWTPDLRRADSASVTRLSVIFGVIALFLVVLTVGFALSTPDAAPPEELQAATPEGTEAAVSPSVRDEPTGGLVMDEVVGAGEVLLTSITLPRPLHDAADALVETTAALHLVADEIAGGDESTRLKSRFAELIDSASRGWFLSTAGPRAELAAAVQRVFRVIGDNAQLGDDLLAELAPEPPGYLDVNAIPVDSWRSGMTMLIADDETVSPIIREQARALLSARGISAVDGPGFAPAALRWLDLRKARLIDASETFNDAELAWLAWMQCVEAVDDSARSQAMLLGATDELAREGLAVGQPGPTRRILARLLTSLDYTDSAMVRDGVLALYVDPDLSPARLWVVTSLLAKLAETPWFDGDSVVDPSANESQRRRQHDRLANRWPVPTRIRHERIRPLPAGFDVGTVDLWFTMWDDTLDDPPGRSAIEMARYLRSLRELNQAAAALADGNIPSALGVIRAVELRAGGAAVADPMTAPSSPSQPTGPVTPSTSPGGGSGSGAGGSTPPRQQPGVPAMQPSAPSGGQAAPSQPSRSSSGWARRMAKARGREAKLNVLDELLQFRSGSLTPTDAAELARVIYTEDSTVRDHARGIVERRFFDDPELVLALLDEMPRNRVSKTQSEFLELIVDQQLPDVGSARWPWVAKRALVERSLALRVDSGEEIDDVVDSIAQSILQESSRLTGQPVPVRLMISPAEAMTLLAEARVDRIRAEMSVEDRAVLRDYLEQHEARERLAGDDLQLALVRSVALLDLVSMEWSITLPSQASTIAMVREDALVELPVAGHVLEQLIIVEEAIGETWRIVLEEFRQRALEDQEATG